MTQNDSIYGGCMSICDESSNSARNHASCNGINCCQMRIPSHLMSFNAVFKDLDGGQGRGRDQCKHAYLVEQRWFHDRLNSSLETPYSVTDMDSVPVVLDWIIDYWIFESLERNGSLADNKTYHCHVNNYDNISSNQKSMVKCSCSASYHGNPYLPGGCPGKLSLCHKNGSLVNRIQGLPFLFHFLLTENKLLLDYLELISVSLSIYMDIFRYQAIRNFVGV